VETSGYNNHPVRIVVGIQVVPNRSVRMMIYSQPASIACVHAWELCIPGYVCKGLSPGLRVVSEVKLILDGQ